MNKVIAALISMTTLVAILLFGIAALLIWAPELLLNFLYIAVIVACVIAGIYLLIPLFITVAVAVGVGKRKTQEK